MLCNMESMGKNAEPPSKKLTAKQTAFVAEYIVDKNATQAAIRAGYSAKTAYSIGQENLTKPEIRAEIDKKLATINEKCGLTTELVIRSLVRDLSFDPAKLLNEDGTPKSIHEIDQDTRMALAGMETIQIGSDDVPIVVRKFKWNQPSSARDQAMKHLGMYREDNSQKTDPFVEFLRSLPGTVITPQK